MRCAMLLAVSSLVLGTTAYGQEVPLHPGQTIRITAPQCGLENHTGSYVDSKGDTLVVAFGTSTMRCAASSVTGLELGYGHKSKVVEGVIIGTLVGAVAGAVFGATTYEECVPESLFDCLLAAESRDQAAIYGTVVGASLGAGVGALVGILTKTDRWVRMPRHRLRVGVAPRLDGGVAFGLTLRF